MSAEHPAATASPPIHRWVLEGQEPCGQQAWVKLHPPEWWSGDTPHDGNWDGEDENDVIRAFRKAYPNRHPAAKGYLAYRVYPKPKVYVRRNRARV